MKTVAIVLAAGVGSRMRDETPKQFAKVAGKTVVEHTLEVFESHPRVDEVFLMVPPSHSELAGAILGRRRFRKVSKLLQGGETRQESSRIGVEATDPTVEFVLVHDAARPFVDHPTIDRILKGLEEAPAVDTVIPTADTIVELDASSPRFIGKIPDRRLLRRGQTPQGFRREILLQAHRKAVASKVADASDDCGLVLRFGLGRVLVVDGSETNIKITVPPDLYVADRIFQLRRADVLAGQTPESIGATLRGLSGKVVVVLGGSEGIGAECVALAKALGAKVHAFSRSATSTDVRSLPAVQAALDSARRESGRVDVVIMTAGVLRMSPLHRASEEEIREQLETNLLGSFFVAKAAAGLLEESKGSLLLFTSSSYTRGRENYSPYSASKAGIVNLVQALGEEWATAGVRVNAVCPERADTPMRWRNFGKEDKATLLSAKAAAALTLIVAALPLSGQVIDVRKRDEAFLEPFYAGAPLARKAG